jgi:hypothetical protein
VIYTAFHLARYVRPVCQSRLCTVVCSLSPSGGELKNYEDLNLASSATSEHSSHSNTVRYVDINLPYTMGVSSVTYLQSFN